MSDSAALASTVAFAREHAAAGISVQDLADHAGYSLFHFTRMFTRGVRIPPGRYLTALRIDEAKRLLLTSTDAVIDVATAVGFDSLSSFAKRFHTTVGVPPARLRRLADELSDATLHPFSLGDSALPAVRVRLSLPAELRPGNEVLIWIGWYPQPAPIGLPAAGRLVTSAENIELPVSPGNPWLLAFSVATTADPLDHLAPHSPVVAGHPAPLGPGSAVTLHFARATGAQPPLLSALPSLGFG